MSNEEATGTFGQLAVGAAFRIPDTFQVKVKVNDREALGLSTKMTYRYGPGEAVRQDWRIEAAANEDIQR